ncbi:MobF family relaxase [Metallibacterium sp.]|uniref:MobF family relaxase n=1 Tax=Metallibacterium sp. TaxID=2940281 RepID=UPI0026059793|nr:MobF family relaxase [Metallibacterium sp.]
MISFSTITSASAAADYYSGLDKAAEYYDGSGRVPSRWLGAGAQIQGLRAEVGRDALRAQLSGAVHDRDGTARQLGIQRAGEFQHRAGWDFTVSAPKSVSVESLVHGRTDVDTAHRKAVNAVVDYLERHAAQARINGQYVNTGNLTIAAYDHVSSRAGDPQLHTHLLVANVTHDAAGRARSVSNERLMEHRKAADGIYHQTLSRELQRLGYAVRHDRQGHVEIASYTPAQLADFSTRSREIEQALAARGQTRDSASAEARQIAALATRAPKNLPETRDAHIERWQAQASLLGIQPADRHAPAAQPEGWDAAQVARQAVADAASHLTEREAVMRLQDLHAAAARMTEGRCGWTDVEAAISDSMRRGELVAGADGRVTTKDLLTVERATDARLEAGRGTHGAVMSGRQFDAALARFERSKGLTLSDEQRAAAKMILTQGDRFQGVQGLAGTGKTTLLSFVREAAEGQGWKVVGHSSGAEQAATMQKESGIASTTTAAWLIEAGKADAAPRDQKVLYVMDEASQSGAKQYLASITATERLGARSVMLGDRFQHQSVEAGRAFARSQSSMPTATLGAGSIRRQRTEHAQAAVARVLSGDHAAAVRGLRSVEARRHQDALPENATRQERRDAARLDNADVIQRLASDYVSMPREQRNSTLVITSTNEDRQALNRAIRQGLERRGDLGPSVEVSTLRKADLTAIELKKASSFEPGQVVEVREDYRRAQLARGSQFTVVETGRDALLVRDAAGKERRIDPGAIKLQAYDKETRALAIGERVRWTENHRAQCADKPLESGLRVRNGAGAVVENIAADGSRIGLRTDSGERIELDSAGGQKLDYAYASTSFSAQGQTVDAVMIHHNTEAGAHGDRESYVGITRARDDVTIYTQDIGRAAAQSGMQIEKSAAHDIEPEWAPVSQPTRNHDHDRDRSYG